jgi:hypothetical protein
MLLCNNCNGGYHLFCFNLELIQIPIDIWYYSSCFPVAPWILFRPCHVFLAQVLGGVHENFILASPYALYTYLFFFFLLISFYLWQVLVFLFSRIYCGFTPLRHWTSQHYTSRKLSCPYVWLHTWRLVTSMPIMLLGLMYIVRLLYAIRYFRVMACLGFQLCWQLYKKSNSSLFLLIF